MGTEAKKLVLKFSSFSSGAASRLPMMGAAESLSRAATCLQVTDTPIQPCSTFPPLPPSLHPPSTPPTPFPQTLQDLFSVSTAVGTGTDDPVEIFRQFLRRKFCESGKFQPRKRTHCLNLQFRLHWFGFLGETGSGSEVSQEETWRQAGFKSC